MFQIQLYENFNIETVMVYFLYIRLYRYPIEIIV